MRNDDMDSLSVLRSFFKTLRCTYKFTVNIFVFLSLIIILGLAIGFASLNAKLVTVNYYMGTVQISLALLLVVCFIMGLFFGMLALTPSLVKLKYFNKRLEKYIKRTEEALEKLKALQQQRDNLPEN
jgi:uncharacterized membrane protein YciS (DUF1049 family)